MVGTVDGAADVEPVTSESMAIGIAWSLLTGPPSAWTAPSELSTPPTAPTTIFAALVPEKTRQALGDGARSVREGNRSTSSAGAAAGKAWPPWPGAEFESGRLQLRRRNQRGAQPLTAQRRTVDARIRPFVRPGDLPFLGKAA